MNGTCPSIFDDFETAEEFNNAFNVDLQYVQLLEEIQRVNYVKPARQHTRMSLPHGTMNFPDVTVSMPLPRVKKLFLRQMLRELLWFCSGQTDIAYLKRHNVNIWDGWIKAGTEVWAELTWADRIRLVEARGLLDQFEEVTRRFPDDLDRQANWMGKQDIPWRKLVGGQLGPVYGAQWRRIEDTQIIFTGDSEHMERYNALLAKGYVKQGLFEAGETGYDNVVMVGYIDQLGDVLDLLDNDPGSSRMVVSAWNPRDLPKMQLPPCHMSFQLVLGAPHYRSLHNVEHVIHMNAYQRSCDAPLGGPFNWASYSTLLHIIAAVSRTKLGAGGLQYSMGDCHIYSNQLGAPMDKLKDQIENELERLAEQETVTDAMIDAPKLKINVPEALTTKWAGCEKYYGTRYRFDEFIAHCMELPDEELFKVFDYTYENYQPHVHFPVSI
jgi:thymidylate synthase